MCDLAREVFLGHPVEIFSRLVLVPEIKMKSDCTRAAATIRVVTVMQCCHFICEWGTDSESSKLLAFMGHLAA